jgi:hypothetical protein
MLVVIPSGIATRIFYASDVYHCLLTGTEMFVTTPYVTGCLSTNSQCVTYIRNAVSPKHSEFNSCFSWCRRNYDFSFFHIQCGEFPSVEPLEAICGCNVSSRLCPRALSCFYGTWQHWRVTMLKFRAALLFCSTYLVPQLSSLQLSYGGGSRGITFPFESLHTRSRFTVLTIISVLCNLWLLCHCLSITFCPSFYLTFSVDFFRDSVLALSLVPICLRVLCWTYYHLNTNYEYQLWQVCLRKDAYI